MIFIYVVLVITDLLGLLILRSMIYCLKTGYVNHKSYLRYFFLSYLILNTLAGRDLTHKESGIVLKAVQDGRLLNVSVTSSQLVNDGLLGRQ